MATKLIITADDYGFTEKVSEGILHCVRQNSISCVSVLMNYVTEKEVFELSDLRNHVNVGIGIHFNLTQGYSLTTKQEFNKALLNDLNFVNDEIELQLQRFIENFGVPDHYNTHHHIHYDLRVLQILLENNSLENIPVRFVNKIMKEILNQYERQTPDIFVNLFPFFSKNQQFQNHYNHALVKLAEVDNLIVEWMVHPGYNCEKLEQLAPDYAFRREVELNILSATSVTEYSNKNIILSTFKDCFT